MHTFGIPSNIKNILKIAKKYKLIVIEDAAEALGSSVDKKQLGTFGNIGVLSFNGNKIVTCGAGGAIMTSNSKIAKMIRHKSQICKINHPWQYDYDDHGYNLKLPSLNAAFGLAQLTRLKSLLKNKKKLFKIYKNFFSKSDFFKILDAKKGTITNYWLNTLILKKNLASHKTNIISSLIKNNVSVRPAWKLLSEINYLKKYPKMNLSQSENLFKRIINIPSGPKVLKKISN